MQKLSEIYKKHLSMKFPDFCENDDLNDWISELAELAGFYAGHIDSIVASRKQRSIPTTDLEKFRNRLDGLTVEDRNDILTKKYCSDYLKVIEEMVLEAKK